MQKIEYSIEYSHIYTNETFSKEHTKSIANLVRYLPDLKKNQYQICVLIDDYNPSEDLLDINKFFNSLKQLQATPDYFAYESKMGEYKDEMLKAIKNNKVRKQYERYISEKNKLPCSFMTGIWYLIRLGVFDPKKSIEEKAESFTPSQRLINILPERFRAVEAKTLELIGASQYSMQVANIDYIFYNGN